MTAPKSNPRRDWEGLVEHRIQEAQAQGAFDNLPGFGQPIPGIDDPLDENWWLRRKLQSEGLTLPQEIAAEHLRSRSS